MKKSTKIIIALVALPFIVITIVMIAARITYPWDTDENGNYIYRWGGSVVIEEAEPDGTYLDSISNDLEP